MVVWIEIDACTSLSQWTSVTTCVVVWIEIATSPTVLHLIPSPPAWWCGLKSFVMGWPLPPSLVTTCVVAWIEITHTTRFGSGDHVTTCVVVWIEISTGTLTAFPSIVTTCVVVWIEIASRRTYRLEI